MAAIRSKKLADKVRAMLAAKDCGRAAYAKCDELMDEILEKLDVGARLDLGNGEMFEIVDNFAGKNKHYKPCGIARFEGKVTRT